MVAAEIAKIHTVEWTTQLLYDEPLYQAMNANWHGLVRTDNKVSRALAHIAVDRLGRSFNESGARRSGTRCSPPARASSGWAATATRRATRGSWAS